MSVHSRCWIVFFAVLTSLGWGTPSGSDLLHALRNGDTAGTRRLISDGAPVDATDEFGSSALMYACLYSDAATVRRLLDRGANPNHADNSGGTALMWAISDPAKVRLLVKRGANVNAVSKVTGRTPLLIAAGRPGAAGVARLLLDKNADANVIDKIGFTPMIAAAASGDRKIVKLLLDRGIDPNLLIKESPLTPLVAAGFGSRQNFELLLARGAEPKSSPVGFSPLAAAVGDVALFRKLMDKGADPRVRSIFGSDTLMIVAALDISVPDVARELLKYGVDPTIPVKNLHTEHGYGTAESPLDWARRLGDTPVARILAEFGNQPAAHPKPITDTEEPKLRAESPSAAIGKALPLLYEGGREFFKRSGCTSCHHNVLPAIAFSLARAKGISLDEEKVRRNSQQSVAWLKGSQLALLQDVPFGGGALTAAYLLWGLAADGHSRDRATDAAVLHLMGSQTSEGLWRTLPLRPPLESSSFTATAIAVKAAQSYMIPQRTTEFQNRIRAAAKWLAATSPRSGEERSMRVLGLAWAATEPRSLGAAADHLLSVQRADGGWAQLDTLRSDAYATGQALYALDVAGRLSEQVLEKAVRFLLDAQLADGSWHVQSRSYPVQSNYFDTGFPHGRDQWISAAGTSWACIGLSLAVKP